MKKDAYQASIERRERIRGSDMNKYSHEKRHMNII